MDNIRAFIHYETTDRPWGGSNSFLHALKTCLSGQESIELVSDKQGDFDLLLLNTAYSAPGRYLSVGEVKRFHKYGYGSLLQYFLKHMKKRTVKVVVRLDGLRRYYAGTSKNRGDTIQLNLTKFADSIIFQSNESLKQFTDVLDHIDIPHYVIHNAVNQEIFNLQGKEYWNKKDRLRIFTTSWSANPMKGFADIARLSRLDGIEVNFVGNWPQDQPPEKVNIHQAVPQTALAAAYKKNDLFFFPSRNEACPNVVLEALSCGLPVIYHPSGGTPETAGNYGVEFTNDLSAAVNEISHKYDMYIQNIHRNHYTFSIEHAAAQYVDVFQRTCNN